MKGQIIFCKSLLSNMFVFKCGFSENTGACEFFLSVKFATSLLALLTGDNISSPSPIPTPWYFFTKFLNSWLFFEAHFKLIPFCHRKLPLNYKAKHFDSCLDWNRLIIWYQDSWSIFVSKIDLQLRQTRKHFDLYVPCVLLFFIKLFVSQSESQIFAKNHRHQMQKGGL